MPAKVVTLCGDLVTYLNGLTLSQAFTAARSNFGIFDVADSDSYLVTVVPEETETVSGTRSALDRTFRVNVIVSKRLTSGDDLADTDAAILLMEEIEDAIYGLQMGGFGFIAYSETAGSRSFVELDSAVSERTFRSVLQISYRGE